MEQKHSRIGIASFITSIVVGILVFSVIVIAGVAEASTPGGIAHKPAIAAVIGLSIIGLLLVDVVALGLGIGGLCQRDRNKIFAILGTVFSSATVVGTILLIILGNLKR